MEPKQPVAPRRVWRMTAAKPQGEILELVPKSAVYAQPTNTSIPEPIDPSEPALLHRLKRTFEPDKADRPEMSLPPKAEPAGLAKVLTPAKVPSWRASSHDLLTGLSVSDVSDTIPGDLLDELFKP